MSGTNETKVFNRALGFLGEPSVETLDPSELSAAGRKMLPFLDAARDQVLGAHHWTVAMHYASLERAADVAVNWKYPYVYNLPDNAIRLVEVSACGYAWEQGTAAVGDEGAERAVIWSDHPGPLKVACIRRIAWAVLPESLIMAVSLRLAALACVGINGDEDRESKLDKRAAQAVLAAIGQEGSQQGGQDPLLDDPYARLRASAG